MSAMRTSKTSENNMTTRDQSGETMKTYTETPTCIRTMLLTSRTAKKHVGQQAEKKHARVQRKNYNTGEDKRIKLDDDTTRLHGTTDSVSVAQKA